MAEEQKSSFGSYLAVIGSILIGLGVLWLVATNWHVMPAFLKIMILVIATIAAFGSGVAFRANDYDKIGGSLLLLGNILFTASVFLIAQIFNFNASYQGNANLLLISFIGVLATSYIFDSKVSLFLGLGEFSSWLFFQFVALAQNDYENMFGYIVILYLFSSLFFFGLTYLHKAMDHTFYSAYRLWTALYALSFAYVMSFQYIIPYLWPNGLTLTFNFSSLFLVFYSLLSVLVGVVGIYAAVSKEVITLKDSLYFAGTLALFIIVIFSAALVSQNVGTCYEKSCYDFSTQSSCNSAGLNNDKCVWTNNTWSNTFYCQTKECYSYTDAQSCNSASSGPFKCVWSNQYYDTFGCTQNTSTYDPDYYSNGGACGTFSNNRNSCNANSASCKWTPGTPYGRETPLSTWIVWIFANILFLFVVLEVIGFATKYSSKSLINIAIGFFVIWIISKYIGFLFDFGGYTSFSIILITGGITLILGGWLIEKWRRKLITQAAENQK